MPSTDLQPQRPALSGLTAEDITRANFEILRRAGRKASTVDQYTRTEKLWMAFCAAQGLNAANFEVVYIDAFFQSVKDSYSRVTLQNMLSHLRKVVEAIAASSDDTAALYLRQLQALRHYKIDPMWGGVNTRKRAGKRVDTATVWAAIHADAPTPLAKSRNAALYALLFFAGLRREELRQLIWRMWILSAA
jgi:integrase